MMKTRVKTKSDADLTSPNVKCRYQLKMQRHPKVLFRHNIIFHETRGTFVPIGR
jgi:hypothetical protein